MFPISPRRHARCFLVECPRRGDEQGWDGSHLLELLLMRDILIAARDCQGSWPRHSAHVRPCNLKPQQRDLTPVLRRPVEPATQHRTWSCTAITDAMCHKETFRAVQG